MQGKSHEKNKVMLSDKCSGCGFHCHSLVAPNCVDAHTATALALLLGPRDAGHEAFIDLRAGVFIGILVCHLHEALTTLTGVASKGVDALSTAKRVIQPGNTETHGFVVVQVLAGYAADC